MSFQAKEEPFARYRPIIDDWPAFQESIKRPLPTTIWANPLKVTPQKLARFLEDAQIPYEPIPWYTGGFRLPAAIKPGLRWEYLAGLFHVQEEVALLPVMLLDVQPEDRVLDLCAAPGNKTAQLAVALHNQGTVIANDRSKGRMRAARQALNRLGLVNITATTVDGANYARQAGNFDKILVDVPCTCEGTCRRDRSLLERPINSQKLVGLQAALLRKAVQRCQPGGRIVYATCTFAPEENEMVVDAILQEMKDQVRLIPAQLPDKFLHSSGLSEWQGKQFDDSLHHSIRVWPHQNDTGGFYIAVLEKMAPDIAEEAVENHGGLRPPDQPVQEREPWLTILEQRFGIETAVFDPFVIYRVGKKKLYIVNREHQPPSTPQSDSVGMHFMRVEGKYPKLTTGAAMLFGADAKRNVIELDAGQLKAYYTRQEIPLSQQQLANVTQNGYVMLRYRGVVVGQGTYYQEGHRVAPLFPKAWVRDVDI